MQFYENIRDIFQRYSSRKTFFLLISFVLILNQNHIFYENFFLIFINV
jgi:hypothetical protein